MKKFMSTKAAAPQPPPPTARTPSPSATPPPPSDTARTFATFEALVRAANPTEHPSSASPTATPGRLGLAKRAGAGSGRKLTVAPRAPPTPRPILSCEAKTMTTTGVKMCGYLKKKRNKMGGWRKLYFILQNQLLLSYSSRDDYEKKLAPFKDIINLVPGTQILPTSGPRFTIVTHSKRCDDQGSCGEWIMALVDSLNAANGGFLRDAPHRKQQILQQRSTLPLASVAAPIRRTPFDRRPVALSGGPPKPPRSFAPQFAAQRENGTTPPGRTVDDDDALNNNVAAPAKAPAAALDDGGGSDRFTTRSGSVKRKILALEAHPNLPGRADGPVPANDDDDAPESADGRRSSSGAASSSTSGGEEKHQHREEGTRTAVRRSTVAVGDGRREEQFDPEQQDRWMWWLRGRQADGQQQGGGGGGRDVQGQGVPAQPTSTSTTTTSAALTMDNDTDEEDDDEADAAAERCGDDGAAAAAADGGAEVGRRTRRRKAEERTANGGSQQQQQQQQQEQQHIFRLHPGAWRKTHQSMDVCRINSMFGERTPATGASSFAVRGRTGADGEQRASSAQDDDDDDDGRKRQQERSEQHAAVGGQRAGGNAGGRHDPGARKPIASSCSALPSVTLAGASSCSDVEIDRPSPEGAPPPTPTPPADPYAVYAEIRERWPRRAPGELREAASEPIYAVVDIRAKRTRRAARQQDDDGEPEPDVPAGQRLGRIEQRHSGAPATDRYPFVSISLPQIPSATGGRTTTTTTPPPPPTDAHFGRGRPVAKRCYSNNNNNNNDYEDVHDFLDRQEDEQEEEEDDDDGGPRGRRGTRARGANAIQDGDEHIYEPILVRERMLASDTSGSSTSLPASSSSGHQSSSSAGGGGGGGLWKHLKRMHLQGSRHRLALRRVFAGSPNTTTTTSTATRVEPDSPSDARKTPPSSALEGLGRRLDSHRRSIKKRIRSLYDRSVPTAATAATTAAPVASTGSPTSSSDDGQGRQRATDGGSSSPPSGAFDRTRSTRQSRKSLSLDSFLTTMTAKKLPASTTTTIITTSNSSSQARHGAHRLRTEDTSS